MEAAPGNHEAIAAWNGVLFDKFTAFRPVVVAGLAPHGDRALALYPPGAGARVIDLGCGWGDSTQQIGALVGPTGRVVGVDCAERFIAAARAEAEAAGATNVRFAVADVEAGVPDGPYDYAFSRFGTMFFTSPVRALRNVRAQLAAGGRLVMLVWRKKEANAAFYVAEQAVRALLGDPPKNDQVTCGPGPFSMASADVTTDIVLAAGYRDPSLARCDVPMMLGRNLAEAVVGIMTLGPAGEVVRLAGDAAVARKVELDAAVSEAMAPFVRPDGTVWAPSTSWIVTATA